MALSYMRRHRRWLYVFLWLVIAAFIILYIPAFQGAQAGSPGEALASVGGLPITVGEFQSNYLRQRQVYERMYPGRVDAAMLKRMGLENQVFEGLVAERVVALEAKRLGLTVDDEAVAREIATAPEYQRDGHFIGTAEIRRILDLRGMSVEEFESAVRGSLLRRKLEELVASGASTSPGEIEREYRRRTEQIKAEYVLVDAARFRSEVNVTEAEIGARFEAQKSRYGIPERRVLSYALIDGEALRPRVSVTDAEIEADYNEHRDEFREPEQVCASHILIKAKATPAAAEGHSEEEAKKIAEGLLQKLRAGGDFAALARASSEDKGSASQGGDLSCFQRGSMVPEFENAAFTLKAGETSELVKTEYGFHIIRVASHRDETLRPLTQVKDPIRQRLVMDRVRAMAEAQAEAVAAALRGGRSLEEAARGQGLAVVKSGAIGRGESVAPLQSPALVARAFELSKGEVEKEAFPVPQGFAFVAVAEIQPPRAAELKEVHDRVKADLVEEGARDKARTVCSDLRLKAVGQGLEKAAGGAGLVRKETPALVGRGQPLGDLGTSVSFDEAAFGLAVKDLSGPLAVPAGYALVRVLEKQGFDPAGLEQQRDAIAAGLRAQKQGELFQAFIDQARKRFVVERHADVFRRVVG
jgi:peptidyl-prolyl cis-trans isomerase D